jgi:hypothetical protein
MEAVMKPFALFKGIAVVALAVGLEAAFLLDVSVPSREVILAQRRAEGAGLAGRAPAAPCPDAPDVDASPFAVPAFQWTPSVRPPRPAHPPVIARRPVARPGPAR